MGGYYIAKKSKKLYNSIVIYYAREKFYGD